MKTKGNYYIYILTNPNKTVLYVGVTGDLKRRIFEHRNQRGNEKTFTGRYYCYKLVYYEVYSDIKQAIYREKEIKSFTRQKKIELIKQMNPLLRELII